MIHNVTSKPWILAMFIRDDGERFLLGSGAYELKGEHKHFVGNIIENDLVEIQGADGSLLAGQVRRANTQPFDGYIGDPSTKKADVEQYRMDFLAFFQKKRFYTVIYVFCDGTTIKRIRGFLVDAPEVQELYQVTPEYHVALNFEDVNYYKYDEDENGKEIFSTAALLPTSSETVGGVMWDARGAMWDDKGLIWEAGGSSTTTDIVVDSIAPVQPTITIQGPAQNPQIENVSTAQTLKYSGNITASQVLVIDTNAQTATLNGVSVLSNVSGDWVALRPGLNKLAFVATGGGAGGAKLEWQEIVG